MYEIRLNKVTKPKFVAAVKKKMDEQRINTKQLAERMGKSVNSLYFFFSNDSKPNRFLAAELANELEIKSEDWR